MAIGDKIIIDENYSLVKDYGSWNLVYSKTGEVNPLTGKAQKSENTSYHMNLRDALKWYLNQAMKDSATVNEILTRIDEVERKIETMEFKIIPAKEDYDRKFERAS